jgi:Domain of unknown function (DUF5668)
MPGLRFFALIYHLVCQCLAGGTHMGKSGIILIVLGCLFLAQNFGLLDWGWLRQWWPMILIGVGVWSILDHKPGDRRPSQDADKKP